MNALRMAHLRRLCGLTGPVASVLAQLAYGGDDE